MTRIKHSASKVHSGKPRLILAHRMKQRLIQGRWMAVVAIKLRIWKEAR